MGRLQMVSVAGCTTERSALTGHVTGGAGSLRGQINIRRTVAGTDTMAVLARLHCVLAMVETSIQQPTVRNRGGRYFGQLVTIRSDFMAIGAARIICARGGIRLRRDFVRIFGEENGALQFLRAAELRQ